MSASKCVRRQHAHNDMAAGGRPIRVPRGESTCTFYWNPQRSVMLLENLSNSASSVPASRALVTVDLQVCLRHFQRPDQSLQIVGELCSDIERFVMVAVLVVEYSNNVAILKAARQAYSCGHVLTCVAQIVQIPSQIDNLRWDPQRIAAVLRLGEEKEQVMILPQVNQTECALCVRHPQANRFPELFPNPYRSSPAFPLDSPTFSSRDPQSGDHCSDGTHGADRIPVSFCRSRFDRAFQYPGWYCHPLPPVPSRYSATRVTYG